MFNISNHRRNLNHNHKTSKLWCCLLPKRQEITNAGKDVKGEIVHYCGNISLYSYYGKQYGVSLKTTNRTTICFTKLTLCIYLREMSMGSQIDSCHPMFIAALVKIVKIWKQPVSNTGIEPRSPALYAYSSPSEPPGKPKVHVMLVKKEKQEKTGKQNFNRVAKQKKYPRMWLIAWHRGEPLDVRVGQMSLGKISQKTNLIKSLMWPKVLLSRQFLQSVSWINGKYRDFKSVKK